ncbi:MAG: hypothetical protein FWC11_01945 [Firmicutes bacterium]|nr:hypothetical protein [Bacillota bacterium]MCL2255603.1 hypothetical protein [Bacillota bacterium]
MGNPFLLFEFFVLKNAKNVALDAPKTIINGTMDASPVNFMCVELNKKGFKIKKTPDFCIEKTLECGQVFRFKKLDSFHHVVYSLNKKCEIFEIDNEYYFETFDPDYFKNYFDIETDYEKIYNSLIQFEELKEILPLCRGIRILKQDLFETIISFVISIRQNIPNIQKIIENICEKFGERYDDYFAFITLENYKTITLEDFKKMKLGFRDKFLFRNQTLITEEFLSKVKNAKTDEAEKLLKSLYGVGDKVISCIMLFALSHMHYYPTDIHIFNAGKTEELNTPEKVRAHYEKRYKKLAGYAQQYMFYAKRNLKIV